MRHLYLFLLTVLFVSVTACDDDEKTLSFKPSFGFASPSSNILESNASGRRVFFYSNVEITEPVTVKVQVNNIVTYGVDFTTDPEPVDGVITVTIDPEDDPEDEQPSFFVLPIPSEDEDDRNISFQIIEVSGNDLSLGQSVTLMHNLLITKTEVVTPGTATIASVRTMSGAITESLFIEGIIISSNDNVTAKSVYIQDATAGIVLRLTEDNLGTFNRGDKVRVALAGTTISAFNGLLQINMTKAQGTVVGTAALPTPRIITIDELNAKTYESQLVSLTGVTFAAANGTLTVAGNTTFSKDGKTSTMRVETYSSFAGKILPSGPVTITGVASVFTTAQLIPQVTSDIP